MYVDLAGLARYKSDFGAWARGRLLPKDAAAARVRTAKAGAVSFVPVQRTPLDVSVDFLFSETPPASGDKSPSNPSTITGVSSVLLSQIGGKNLLAYNFEGLSIADGTTKTISGLTISNDKGVYTFSGQATSQVNIYITHITEEPNKLKLMPGTYTLSGYTSPTGTSAGDVRVAIYYPDGTSSAQICYAGSKTFTVSGTEPVTCNVYIRSTQGVDYGNGFVCRPQLERGSEATAFEPSYVTSYTLPLGSTYYGGTLDVASGVMTVKSQKLMIDENCIFTFFNDPVTTTETRVAIVVTIPSFPTSDMTRVLRDTSSCDSFPLVRPADAGDSIEFIMFGNVSQYVQYKQIRIYMLRSTLGVSSSATATEINNAAKAWFTSHPATFIVGYDEEPRWTTVQLTPTEILSLTQSSVYDPRLNTVYSDQQAVQVGYLKHPSAASADLRNAAVSLGGGV